MGKVRRTVRRTGGQGKATDSGVPLGVAVIVDPSLPYDREIAAGVAQYAREVSDWQLYLELEEPLRRPDLRAWRGHGIVANFDDERIARLVTSSGLPAVAIGGGSGYHDPASGIPYIHTDDRRIGEVAAEHLLDRGFTDFGFYGVRAAPIHGWSANREAGFRARLEADSRGCATFNAHHDATAWNALQEQLQGWLRGLPRPVGIMACDDVRGRHLVEACRVLGLDVPRDVAVIGVDDDEFICELTEPPLTSVAHSARRIGHEAARVLDRLMRPERFRIRGAMPAAPPPRLEISPTGVVARRSTATIAVGDPLVARAIGMVRERACRGLTIRAVVEATGLSRWVLEDRFKRSVGHSIHEDIVRVKLAEACRLITTTDLPLKTVGRRAGFSTVSYMTTMFRRRLGRTPAQFRREHQRPVARLEEGPSGGQDA
jgi:LacI family transcriptional regulator